MSVARGELITEEEYIALKKIAEREVSVRSDSRSIGSMSNYNGNAYKYDVTPSQSEKVLLEHIRKITVPLDAICGSNLTQPINSAINADVLNEATAKYYALSKLNPAWVSRDVQLLVQVFALRVVIRHVPVVPVPVQGLVIQAVWMDAQVHVKEAAILHVKVHAKVAVIARAIQVAPESAKAPVKRIVHLLAQTVVAGDALTVAMVATEIVQEIVRDAPDLARAALVLVREHAKMAAEEILAKVVVSGSATHVASWGNRLEMEQHGYS